MRNDGSGARSQESGARSQEPGARKHATSPALQRRGPGASDFTFAPLRQMLWVIVGILLMAACANQPALVTQSAQVDGITISIEHPPSAVLLQSYDLIIALKDANQQPIDGADVALDLVMPAMSMGANKPVAAPIGQGRYRITTAYTMEGDWIITVFVEVGSKRVQATFNQMVKAK